MHIRISLLLLIVALCWLFVSTGFSDGHSARFNYAWTSQYLTTFAGDALLPRHMPGLWNGLGGHDFFFYGPMPFWTIAALVSPLCADCSVETHIVLGAMVFWVLSGLTLFLFLRRYVEGTYAVIGAIVYAILPYHLLLDWLVRQAFGEFAAYAFIPLVAYGVDSIRTRTGHPWALAVGIAGTALCHLPVALLTVHLVAVISCVVAWQKHRTHEDWQGFLFRVTLWGTLGGLLSCFYWLPALVLIDTVDSNFLFSEYYVASNWLYGLAFDQPSPGFAAVVFYSFLAVLPFIVAASAQSTGYIRIWIAVPVLTVFFLNTEWAGIIWDNWIISKVQFPWRMMVFVDFSAAVAVALLAQGLKPHRATRVIPLCVALAAIPALSVIQETRKWMNDYEATDAPAGALEYLSPQMTTALKARLDLPVESLLETRSVALQMQDISAKLNQTIPETTGLEISHRRALLTAAQDDKLVNVPIQFWSFWQAELDGGIELALSASEKFGTIEVSAPPDGFQGRQITLTLPYHWSERLGFWVSLLSSGLLVLYIIQRSVMQRRL